MDAVACLCLVGSALVFAGNSHMIHRITQCSPTVTCVSVVGTGIASRCGAGTGRTGNRLARVLSGGLYS